MRHGSLLLASLVLSACAATAPAPRPAAPENLLHDAVFEARPVPAQPDVFAVSAPMRRYLESDIAAQLRDQGRLRGLVAALESHAQLRLDYESSVTRTAAEAFAARAGNCLSLTVMTAALARELGLQVSFQRVFSEPVWSRSNDTLYASGHVNIVLEPSAMRESRSLDRVKGIVVDFMPGADLRRQRSQEIEAHTVVAMFMNNRAAEALNRGALDEAYWWARGATRQDARFLEAFNTLGVVYARHGDLAPAERVFGYVLKLETENVSALANLAGTLERLGRHEESRAYRQRLRQIEAQPPFHFFDLGLAALKRKEFAAARDHFARELQRNAFYHEAHFGLAVAYLALGETAPAQRHLATALETSTSRREHDIYAAKLAWLRARAER